MYASTVPHFSTAEASTRDVEEEIEEIRRASSSSSPCRHFSSLPTSGSRRSSKIFGFSLKHGARNAEAEGDDPHPVLINGVESTPTSQYPSPWASSGGSPSSTPASSIAHGDLSGESPPAGRTPEKKRSSWLGSVPASHFTPYRTHPCSSESPASSPPTSKRGCKALRLRRGSSSSSSLTSSQHGDAAKDATAENAVDKDKAESLIPNAQFLGLMLLMILLISSPLIKVLSVLLFVALVVLDDA